MIELRRVDGKPPVSGSGAALQKTSGASRYRTAAGAAFVVVTKVGGQAFGAYDGDAMVGFLLRHPGIEARRRPYLHSHMLGVLPEYRERGVGRMLKLRQREDALARGIGLIEWTFDPLELKNAFFNMERLGAIVRRYVENQYGITTSPLHGGLPTDRCVRRMVAGQPAPRRRSGAGAPPDPPRRRAHRGARRYRRIRPKIRGARARSRNRWGRA
jgi:predicted GNAT superfamily acetyltransferase